MKKQNLFTVDTISDASEVLLRLSDIVYVIDEKTAYQRFDDSSYTVDDITVISAPKSLEHKNSRYVAVFGENVNCIWTFDFMTDLTIDIYAPFNIKINSVYAIVNDPTTTITVDSNPYSLGDTITTASLITITVDINSVINLIVKT